MVQNLRPGTRANNGPTLEPKYVPRTYALFGGVNDEYLREQTYRDKSDEIHVERTFHFEVCKLSLFGPHG